MANTAPENQVPDEREKETFLKNIADLTENIAECHKSIKLVGVLVVVSAFLYIAAGLSGFDSPFMLPILFIITIGNQVYITRTRHKEKKLVEMKNAYESKFGLVAP